MNDYLELNGTVAMLRCLSLEGVQCILLEYLTVHHYGVALYNMLLYIIVVRLVDDEVEGDNRVTLVNRLDGITVDVALREFLTVKVIEVTFTNRFYNRAILNRQNGH